MNFFKISTRTIIPIITVTVLISPLMANEKYDSAFLEESQYLALPELKTDLEQNEVKTAIPRIKCFVDTPEYDSFTFNQCDSQGAAFTTSAVFQIDYIPSGITTIQWSDSRCDNTSNICILPIRQKQIINLFAYVVINSVPYIASAEATYEGIY